MGRRTAAGLVVALTLVAAACSGDDAAGPTTTDVAGTGTDTDTGATPTTEAPATSPPTTDAEAPDPEPSGPEPADADLVAAIEAALGAGPEGCDPLDARHCFLPFPSDALTTGDPSSNTGRRVAFPQAASPVNVDGVPAALDEWNRNDGFSPNTRIQVYLDDLDMAASDLPPWTDLAASLDDTSPVVLIDVATGERIPLWAEPDEKTPDPADRMLVIHPAITLPPATTFAMALRGLVDTAGDVLDPGPVFRSYRDQRITEIDAIEDRRDDMDDMFDALEGAGVARDNLQLAWTFTTASTDNVTGRMVHIRDETLAELGDAAPGFEVTEVIPDEREGTARQVVGTFTVTNWLTGDGSAGNGFDYGDADLSTNPDALPTANGTIEAPFMCNIPDSVLAGSEPGHLVQYGHGLLGAHREINAGNVRDMSNEYDAVYCATKWAGMSEDDVGNAVNSLMDMSNFPTLTDRLQQGVLNQIVLGRLMRVDDGLVSHPAFQRDDGTPLIDNERIVYDGNSQGGIMGLMLVGVSPDLERAILGVPGMNYSMLLPRSVDFDTYEEIFIPAYPSDFDRSLLISMIQMLWDRGEGAGYVRHVASDPLPGTPTTDVLLHVAFGDWQVTELSAYIIARTMGIPIHRPVTADGRSAEVEPGWGIDTLEYPWPGSAMIMWDSGTDPIPFEGVPPRSSRDSHEDPRADANVRVQKAAFLFDDVLIDVCGAGEPCTAAQRD